MRFQKNCLRQLLRLGLCGVISSWGPVNSAPILQVVRSAPRSLLKNGSFEEIDAGRSPNWTRAPQGYQTISGEGRNHSIGIVAENSSGTGSFGASQTILLNRTIPAPLVIEGWSKALNVTGGSDSGYSLYVDLAYADGSQLWGQTASFHAGTHDWQRRRFTIFPEKPVKSLTLHCLFRGHAGKAWFDDITVEEISPSSGTAVFQGATVKMVPTPLHPATSARKIESSDGLSLSFEGDALTGIRIGSRELKKGLSGGFLVRDVAADSGFFSFTQSQCPELGLQIRTEMIGSSNRIAIEGRVSDITGKDRAITLVFALPLAAAEGWNWGDDIRRSRAISGNDEFSKQVSVKCGATGTQSLYPIAPIWDKQSGLAIGLDMGQPAVFRTGYHAGLQTLFIAYDFALVKDTERFPSSADFRFVLYRFESKEGFRAAWQKFTEIFPSHFEVRVPQQGLWMPFTDVSTVKGWEDFGFRFHEGNNNVGWDDEHGILSFRYTEPMTWWMRMKTDIPRTVPNALRVRDEIAQGNDSSRQRMANVTELSAMQDENGEPALLFRNEPWANGAVWSLNPNPFLTATNQLNAATVYWNDQIKERLYGAGARGQLDGEYLDSLEGYVTAELNFRRDHFRFSTVPLTFSTETGQPALFKGLAVYEFTHWLAEDVHKMGRLMFANGVPYRFTWLCPWLDVLGTETDWLRDGKYHPVPLETTDLWRTLAGGKPYLLLMNTDYDKFTPPLVEKYFQRALFYGMWPGFFSHNAADNPYWKNPKWYERDRPLFLKYIPLIRRVAEAGWQPSTDATCDNRALLLERFGSDSKGSVYLTLFNPSSVSQTGVISIDTAVPRREALLKALFGSPPERVGEKWRVSLGAEEVALWQLSGGK